MKGKMKKNKLNYKILALFVIGLITFSYFTPFIHAESTIPNDIKVVTNENEKKQLLGTTSEEARAKNILGLAGEFSVFTKENIEFSGADSEGRIAAGGTISSSTRYKYQAGTELSNDNLAKIIARNGFNNMELNSTKHYTLLENSKEFNIAEDSTKKKIAVVGTNASDMDWNSLDEADKKQVIASDLIDFDSEFEWLNNKSNELVTQANGEIIRGQIVGGKSFAKEALILRGNSDVNIFNFTVEEFNTLFDLSRLAGDTIVIQDDGKVFQNNAFINNIVFDVPKDSSVVINIIGEGTVEENMTFVAFTEAGEDDILSSEIRSGEKYDDTNIFYAFDGEDFIRDENGAIKPLKIEFNPEMKHSFYSELASKLLFNLPQVSNIILGDNCIGSILAPNADIQKGTDNYNRVNGFFDGTLVAKSYSGDMQFRHALTHHIPIQKVFNKNAPMNDAQFKITDLDGNEICSWKSGTEGNYLKYVDLKAGTYILEETTVPDNYEISEVNKMTFVVSNSDTAPYYTISNQEKQNFYVNVSTSIGGRRGSKRKNKNTI